ncbi:MAG: non-canonical purine NTP pyrophosphatase [Thermodesulfobacteriota bacterium]
MSQQAYRQLKRPILVEDFSMRFEALGGLPGPLIKWFLQELKPEGLCKLLDSYESRTAYAQTCFAYCAGDEVQVFEGVARGIITDAPRGSHGYGIEAIFIPVGWEKTWGQMNKEEQVASSVRRIGLKKLEAYLSSL